MNAAFIYNLAPAAFGISVGLFLRQSICSRIDGETVAKFAAWITLPSLILQTANRLSLSELQLPILAAATLTTAITALSSWIAYRNRHPRERALLSGSSVGGAFGLFTIPFAAALFGPQGVLAALLCGPITVISTRILSFGLFSTAGPAFPASFAHDDGGSYRGEWKGMSKEGHGVYTYTSGAKYEGEWRAGRKEGRGVYRFPKGGVYEGEWREGVMSGIGVRTMSSGKVQSGLWENGMLKVPLEEWQCALAVEGANEAAAVARRVRAGAAGVGEGGRLLAADPVTWAYVAAVGLIVSQFPLTPTVQAVTNRLAQVHVPLALFALGLTLDINLPEQKEIRDASGVLAARLLPPLLLSFAALALLPRLGYAVHSTVQLIGPFLLWALAPISPAVQGYAHEFRLNEKLAAGIATLTMIAAFGFSAVLSVSSAATNSSGSLTPLFVAVGSGILACSGLLAWARKVGSRRVVQKKVKMVYRAPVAQKQVQSEEKIGEQPIDEASSNDSQTATTTTGDNDIQNPVVEEKSTFKDVFTDVDGSAGDDKGSAPQAVLNRQRQYGHHCGMMQRRQLTAAKRRPFVGRGMYISKPVMQSMGLRAGVV